MKLPPRVAKIVLLGFALILLTGVDVSAGETNDAAQALVDHITATHRSIIVDTNRTRTAWSDGVILEVATNFPSAVEQLVLRPSRYQSIHPYLDQLAVAESGVWKRSKMRSKNKEGLRTIVTTDGSVKIFVNSLYLDYAFQRYTNATLWIKGPFDPVVVRAGTQICAAIMPIKPELAEPGTGIRVINVTNIGQ